MNQINLNNYEAYLLDLSEGKLTEEMQMELELFLMQHPELSIDLSNLSLIGVDIESIAFEGKQQLKKTEHELISETQFISYIEGLSDEKEKLHIEKSCSLNPTLRAELELYKHSIAETDKAIVHPNKNSLKRKPKVIWLKLGARQFAAAASVLFILGLIFLWPKTTLIKQESSLAKNDTIKVIPKNDLVSQENHTLAKNSTPAAVLSSPNNTIVITKTHNAIVPNNNSIAIKTNPINTLSVSVPEQVKDELNNNTVDGVAQNKNETVSSVPKSHAVVETIVEVDNESLASDQPKKKKGIWAIAGKALKSLNTLGVKSVDGEEEKNNTYALTLGGLNITHKSAENL